MATDDATKPIERYQATLAPKKLTARKEYKRGECHDIIATYEVKTRR